VTVTESQKGVTEVTEWSHHSHVTHLVIVIAYDTEVS